MVVLADGTLAMGRYEVTLGEYRAFASATGGGGGGDCIPLDGDDSWRDPGFAQTDRHPVTCVSWDDAQAYVSWLSRTTGATYPLADGGRNGSGRLRVRSPDATGWGGERVRMERVLSGLP